jgi:hypothetical protein
VFSGFRTYAGAAAASVLVLGTLAPTAGVGAELIGAVDQFVPPCDGTGCVLLEAGGGATLAALPPTYEPGADAVVPPDGEPAAGVDDTGEAAPAEPPSQSSSASEPLADGLQTVTDDPTQAAPSTTPSESSETPGPGGSNGAASGGDNSQGDGTTDPGTSVTVPGDGTTTAAQARQWGTPKYVENFDAGLSGWNLYDGPGHAGNGRRSPGAATTAGGVLTISGDSKGTTEGMAWRLGASKYGRWEGRMRAPVSDPSYNALMLLWPDAENFPVGGEIDFVEMLDHTRKTTDLFLHYGASNNQVHGQVAIDATQWHNWAVEWTPRGVAAYVDGKVWWSTSDTSILPPGPMHLCLQLDWFPKGGAVTPSQMFVDWVAFYPVDGSGLSAPIANSPGGTTAGTPAVAGPSSTSSTSSASKPTTSTSVPTTTPAPTTAPTPTTSATTTTTSQAATSRAATSRAATTSTTTEAVTTTTPGPDVP